MKVYNLLQGLKDSNTTSIQGTYTDKDTATAAVERFRGGGVTAHREARYFIQEVEVEEVAPIEQEKPKDTKEQPKPGAGVIPHTATTFSESGEPLNQPLAPQYTSTKKDEDKEAEEEDTDAGHKRATHAAGHTHHAVSPSKKK